MTNLQYTKIKELCIKRGMSVTAMSKKAGLSTSTMSNLKSGKVKVLSIESCRKVAKALGVRPEEIYFLDLERPVDELDKDLNQMGTSIDQMFRFDDETEERDRLVEDALLRDAIVDLILTAKRLSDKGVRQLIQIAKILEE